MSTLRWSDKDPSDVWDFTLDATRWISAIADTLASVSAAVAPAGLTLGATSVTPAGLATVRISSGAANTDYLVTLTLTTTGGRILQRSVQLLVRDL